MRILAKSQDRYTLISTPDEEVELGDYLGVSSGSGIETVIQVYDIGYLDSSSLSEEIVREEILSRTAKGHENDPINLSRFSLLLTDLRVLLCKVRGWISKDGFRQGQGPLPSRASSRVRRLRVQEILSICQPVPAFALRLGTSSDGEPLDLPGEAMDGSLTVIAGKKGTGKSHLSKLLAGKLSSLGANCVIFDLNDEYRGLRSLRGGDGNSGVLVCEPGVGFRLTLEEAGRKAVLGILGHTLETPASSYREFVHIWDSLENRGMLTFSGLLDAVSHARCNEFVREALYSRMLTLLSTRIFTDDLRESVDLGDLLSARAGCIIILNLARVNGLTRRIAVELVLEKLAELLATEEIPPLFLFAEEAHLYLRETYWDDLVTRMRHYGLFPIFITNQPDAIPETIYRQMDNLFLFNFPGDHDMDAMARAASTDSDTVRSLTRCLVSGNCMVLGRAVSGLPVIMTTAPASFPAGGATRLLFQSGRDR